MKEHYNFSDAQMANLEKKGITISDLFHMVKDFEAENAPVSKVSLMHFIDSHGDFTEKKNKKAIVANAVLENLHPLDQISIGEYLDAYEEGFEDEQIR